MTVEEASRPYIRQAEQETEPVSVLASQVHRLLIETAAQVVDDGGESRHLLHALEELSTASRQMWEAVDHLTTHRAEELWLETQRPMSA